MTDDLKYRHFLEGQLGLEYNGRKLTSTPSNCTVRDCLVHLKARKPFTVVLEPGDATRYMLVFTPLWKSGLGDLGMWSPSDVPDLWMVTRVGSGHHFHTVVLHLRHGVGHFNIGQLAGGNSWTADLLVQWVAKLFAAATEGWT